MTEKRNNKDVDSTTEFKKLSIQISLNGLSFCVVDVLDNTVLLSKNIIFEKELNPFEVQKELTALFELHKIPTFTFTEVVVIHRNNLFTLVPKALFNEDELANYLKFNTKILANDLIVFDEIESHDMVNVYVPLVNINNYIYDLFGEFEYKHSSTVIIPSLLTGTNNGSEPLCYVYTSEQQMDITIIQNKKLLLFNSYIYNTKEDFMYYLLFTLEQLHINSDTIKLRLFGNIEEDSNVYQLCHEHVKNVSIFVPESPTFHIENEQENTIDFTVLNTL